VNPSEQRFFDVEQLGGEPFGALEMQQPGAAFRVLRIERRAMRPR